LALLAIAGYQNREWVLEAPRAALPADWSRFTAYNTAITILMCSVLAFVDTNSLGNS
jgi:hypothetical protein